MTTKSGHGSRKSKLEPRVDIDYDDEIIRKLEVDSFEFCVGTYVNNLFK